MNLIRKIKYVFKEELNTVKLLGAIKTILKRPENKNWGHNLELTVSDLTLTKNVKQLRETCEKMYVSITIDNYDNIRVSSIREDERSQMSETDFEQGYNSESQYYVRHNGECNYMNLQEVINTIFLR